MASTASSPITDLSVNAHEIEGRPAPKMSCLRRTIQAIQMGCLVLIPLVALSLVTFMSVFAVKCDGSGGFVISRTGSVLCMSSKSDESNAASGREVKISRLGAETFTNGTVVMTVTRVVLISVSILIVSFTAWVCVWYQRYGGSRQPTQTNLASSSALQDQGQLESILTIRVNEYFKKADLERLLGPEHSAAPAV